MSLCNCLVLFLIAHPSYIYTVIRFFGKALARDLLDRHSEMFLVALYPSQLPPALYHIPNSGQSPLVLRTLAPCEDCSHSTSGFMSGKKVAQMVKNLPAMQRLRFNPWVKKIPWRREQLPTSVFLPRESQGQRTLVGYSPWGHKESATTQRLTLSFSISLVPPQQGTTPISRQTESPRETHPQLFLF